MLQCSAPRGSDVSQVSLLSPTSSVAAIPARSTGSRGIVIRPLSPRQANSLVVVSVNVDKNDKYRQIFNSVTTSQNEVLSSGAINLVQHCGGDMLYTFIRCNIYV